MAAGGLVGLSGAIAEIKATRRDSQRGLLEGGGYRRRG
jgi:hypothetical protein